MASVIETYTVITKGKGTPDYSNTVSSSKERAGLLLTEPQTLEIFGYVFTSVPHPPPCFAWVNNPLPIGATALLIDNITGLAMPFVVPKGYIMTLISAGVGTTQDAIAYGYVDGVLATNLGVFHSGSTTYQNKVIGLTTATLDPTGATAHTIAVTITNLGDDTLEGGIEFTAILEAVGTPPFPTTKVIKCKFCGYERTVPVTETRLKCPKCSKETLVYALANLRKTS